MLSDAAKNWGRKGTAFCTDNVIEYQGGIQNIGYFKLIGHFIL